MILSSVNWKSESDSDRRDLAIYLRCIYVYFHTYHCLVAEFTTKTSRSGQWTSHTKFAKIGSLNFLIVASFCGRAQHRSKIVRSCFSFHLGKLSVAVRLADQRGKFHLKTQEIIKQLFNANQLNVNNSSRISEDWK